MEDIDNVKTKLADTLFETIPTGVVSDDSLPRHTIGMLACFLSFFALMTRIDFAQGAGGIIRRLSVEELDEVLTSGMKWAEKENLVWEDDR